MRLKNRPYSIYAHDKKGDNEALWFRVRSFKTMADALNSLQDLTKVSKDKRQYLYIILPNEGQQRRYIIFKDEHKDNVLNSAR